MKLFYRIVVLHLVCIAGVLTAAGQTEKKLSVETCVEIALENNPDLVKGRFTVQMAGKDVSLALANFLPTISARLGYDHSVRGPAAMISTTINSRDCWKIKQNTITRQQHRILFTQ